MSARECCSNQRVELQNREDFTENVAKIGVLSYKVGKILPRMLLKSACRATKSGRFSRECCSNQRVEQQKRGRRSNRTTRLHTNASQLIELCLCVRKNLRWLPFSRC